MISSPRFCTSCGAANSQQAAFCHSCGQPLQATMISEREQIIPGLLLKDRYHIVGQLGKGGMGAVYQAEDTLFRSRAIAVKEMSQEGLSAQQRNDAAADFKREAHMLAELHHPGLPTIYDYFSDAGRWYLVMDFIAGETLEDYLAHTTQGWLAEQEALAIGQQLCDVLLYLHTRQPPIIFRDLKPANVMYTADKHIYLIDFGIARHFKPGQLRDTVAFGSAGYAAPEQYGKTQTTPCSDIYSLGAILHQCLSGNDPASNIPTPFDFPPLDLHGQPAPTELTALIKQMLTLHPDSRPSDMHEVSQRLQSITATVRGQSENFVSIPPEQPAATSIPPRPITPPKITRPLPMLKQVQWTVTAAKPPIPPKPHPFTAPKADKTTTYGSYKAHKSGVRVLACSPDHTRAVTGDSSGKLQVWCIDDYKTTCLYEEHNHSILRTVAWSPNQHAIASGDSQGLLTTWQPVEPSTSWRVGEGERIYSYRGHGIAITGLAWSLDSSRLAVSDNKGRVHLQNASNGIHICFYPGSRQAVHALGWSPNGQWLASSNEAGHVQVWEVESGKIIRTYSGHETRVLALVWSPDSRFIASSDGYGRVHVIPIAGDDDPYIYRGHFGSVTALAWSPDGTRIASGGEDRTVQLWDAHSGEHVFTYREHQEFVSALAWPRETHILSASMDKTVRVWQPKAL